MTRRVVGIGQPAAGDDGVGPAVVQALAERELPAGTELHQVREASALVELLRSAEQVVVVDAVAGAVPPGTVVVVDSQSLADEPMSAVSSHGVGVVQAIELARTLYDDVTGSIRFVAVGIDPPQQYGHALSDEVKNAIPEAVAAVVRLLTAGTPATTAPR